MMRSCVRSLVCGMVALGFMFAVGATSVLAGNKVLDKETFLNTPSSGNPAVFCKANTSASLNDKGEVQSCTLAKDAFLKVPSLGSPASHFKAGTEVSFDDKGAVIRGTLSQDAYLNRAGANAATFKAGTTVSFDSKGHVTSGTPAPSADASVVNETSWTVNNHPVPWVFHSNGTVEAPGLWKGNWTKSGDDYKVNLTHQGATDSFVVKFAPDGKTFTAYKSGSTYRNGVRNK